MTDRTENGSLARKAGLYALIMNYLPFIYLLAGAGLVWRMQSVQAMTAAGLAWIYLLPPLTARLVLLVMGPPAGDALPPRSRRFKVWWFLTQLQMVFNRLRFLEELLRLVPGLYSLWLNLWGSRVSLFVFWVSGVLITDRYLLNIGPGVIVSADAALAGHLSTYDAHGNYVTSIARITIEKGAIIGARAGIGPGCVIGAFEVVPAGKLLPPYSRWRDGRRTKREIRS